jgi:prepilin-type N-terminal cleavage/methylation domain-containing protein
MIWICPRRTDRPHGALPRLRGRRGRRPFGVPRTCRARAKRSGAPGVATPYGLASEATLQGWRHRRHRKQGGAPRGPQGFSLVEVLASLFILTLSAVGITAAWRLADYQELLTRADRRAERILRQYYELQTFAPADSRPFTANASASPSPSPITGYLYYPRLVAGQSSSGQFGKMIPFSISMTNGTAGTQLVLTYTIPSYGSQASRQVTKTVALNP